VQGFALRGFGVKLLFLRRRLANLGAWLQVMSLTRLMILFVCTNGRAAPPRDSKVYFGVIGCVSEPSVRTLEVIIYYCLSWQVISALSGQM